MSWSTAYKAGPPSGGLSTLLDFATSVRVLNEWSLGYRGQDPTAQYVHGDESSPRKFHPSATFNIECVLRETDPSGAVVHPDGVDGHRLQNFSSLKKIFAGTQGNLVRIQRTMPDSGTTYLDAWQIGTAQQTQNRITYSWPMQAPRPFWIGAADLANTPPILTVNGDASIDDMIIKITDNTSNTPRLTHTPTGDWIEIDGLLPAGGVQIDVGNGTCTKITGGADYSNKLRVSSPWWLELDPGANAVVVSQVAGATTVNVDWNTKWR